MKNKFKTLMVLTAGLVGTLVLTSCGEETYSETDYTYNTYITSKIGTWNVHDWETNDESYINAFTEIGLYDCILNSTKDGYEFVTEMASEFPYNPKNPGSENFDATVDLSSDELNQICDFYGFDNIQEGQIWDIKLNPNAKWEDGTPITATDYVESMKRQLDPKLVNYRADSYYSSTFQIVNAEDFYKSGRYTIEALYNYINTDTMEYKNNTIGNTIGEDYYINLGVYTPFVKTVFSNADESTILYEVFNQVGTNMGSEQIKVVSQRIIDAVQYYLLHYVDHTYGDDANEWKNVQTPGEVKSTMMNYDIPIMNFDQRETQVKVRTSRTGSWADEGNNLRVYTRDDMKNDLNLFLRLYKGINKEHSYRMILSGKIKNNTFTNFEKVGIKAKDQYSLRLILKKSISLLDLKFALTSNWLVKTDLYDRLTTTGAGGMKQTSYATVSENNYCSYGPYKLERFTEGHSFYISRNDQWYGYTDGNHVGQYQMTGCLTTVIETHSTARGMFEKGELDDLSLDANDMKTYGNSSRLTTTPESYTQKISFNSDRTKLESRQKGNENKTILANDNFRKGLSLAINRNEFASKTTAGSKPFTGLLNELYLTNVEKGEMYNSTEEGKSVYNKVYDKLGGDPYADDYEETSLSRSSQGYNLQQATYFVEKAIKEEIESGALKSGNNIAIEFRVYDNESSTTVAMVDFLQTSFKNVLAKAVEKYNTNNGATINLSLSIEAVKDEDYYNSAKSGNYDMIFSIWGGAAINPYGLMQVYCDSEFESTCEYGFKGKQNKVMLEIDGEVKSFEAWYDTMVDINDDSGEANHKRKVSILASLEAGILNRFEAIPIVARGSSSLTSFKVENGSSTYINLIGYGGIRFMKFNFNDKTWHEYITSSTYSSDLYKL